MTACVTRSLLVDFVYVVIVSLLAPNLVRGRARTYLRVAFRLSFIPNLCFEFICFNILN